MKKIQSLFENSNIQFLTLLIFEITSFDSYLLRIDEEAGFQESYSHNRKPYPGRRYQTFYKYIYYILLAGVSGAAQVYISIHVIFCNHAVYTRLVINHGFS